MRIEYDKTWSQAKHMPLVNICLTPLNLGSLQACVFDIYYRKPFLLSPYVADGLIICLCKLCSGVRAGSYSQLYYTTLMLGTVVCVFVLADTAWDT